MAAHKSDYIPVFDSSITLFNQHEFQLKNALINYQGENLTALLKEEERDKD